MSDSSKEIQEKNQYCKYLLRKIYLTKSTYFKSTIQNFQSVLVGPTMQKNNVEQVTIKHRHHFMMSKKTEIFFSNQTTFGKNINYTL